MDLYNALADLDVAFKPPKMSGKKECVVCKKSLLAMDQQVSEGGNSYHKT